MAYEIIGSVEKVRARTGRVGPTSGFVGPMTGVGDDPDAGFGDVAHHWLFWRTWVWDGAKWIAKEAQIPGGPEDMADISVAPMIDIRKRFLTAEASNSARKGKPLFFLLETWKWDEGSWKQIDQWQSW